MKGEDESEVVGAKRGKLVKTLENKRNERKETTQHNTTQYNRIEKNKREGGIERKKEQRKCPPNFWRSEHSASLLHSYGPTIFLCQTHPPQLFQLLTEILHFIFHIFLVSNSFPKYSLSKQIYHKMFKIDSFRHLVLYRVNCRNRTINC